MENRARKGPHVKVEHVCFALLLMELVRSLEDTYRQNRQDYESNHITDEENGKENMPRDQGTKSLTSSENMHQKLLKVTLAKPMKSVPLAKTKSWPLAALGLAPYVSAMSRR